MSYHRFFPVIVSLLFVSSGFSAPPPGYTIAFDQEFYDSRVNINTLIAQGTGWGAMVAPNRFACHVPDASDFGSSFFSGPQDAKDGISPFRIDPSGHLRIKVWFDSTANHLRSGLLSTVDYTGKGFAIANGYYQCAVYIPRAGGTWPSFWLKTLNSYSKTRNTNATEIDVFEIYGDQVFHDPTHINFTTTAHESVHEWSPTGGQVGAGVGFSATVVDPISGKAADLSSGPHTFGCLISGQTISFDIDDVTKFTTPMPASGVDAPFFMMIDLATGGGWPIDDMPLASPNANPPGWNTYPQEMVVYWIRAYAPPAPPTSPSPSPSSISRK